MGAQRLVGLGVCCALLLAWRVSSQELLRVKSDLVLVPVTVSDCREHPVQGLTKESFRVFDNGVEQTITHFSKDDAPISIGLVFDTSGSMRFRLDRSRLAAEAFFHAANPEDEFFLVDFANTPTLSVPLTRDVSAIEERIASAHSVGPTALLDAIYLALNEMRKSHLPRKAILVVSDGGDNDSRYTLNELRRALRESDVVIYSIGVFSRHAAKSKEEAAGPGLLRSLSESTGGRLIPVTDILELPYIAVKVGIEMRNRYVLGYAPTKVRDDGRYHHLSVKLVAPSGMAGLRASWRAGYYAPTP
ncbi:MAG TPA: VWA domain-containing protein [Candidatus Sulfopaludibacter sp.]|jgi:VWFA-related protein|nr:VWA domain-containing protein [Candidatus Sulfopaludibacter sp.]